METEIREIYEKEEKSEICDSILRKLPNWFGNEEAIADYKIQVRNMGFCVAYIDEKAIGFIAVKEHNKYTAEICVMGVLTDYHRQGMGKKLFDWCESYCSSKGNEFLTVKTLDGSRASKSYEKTRLFYLSLGFKPLEVFPLFWDKDNPCLFLAKYIGKL